MKRKTSTYGFIYGLILWISLSFTALIAGTANGKVIENTASAQYRDAGGFVHTIQSQTVVTLVDEVYILDIVKDVEKTSYHALDTVRYHIDLTNSGNIAVSSLTVTDSLSDDLSYVNSQPPATISGQVISWNLQNIQAGASEGIDLVCILAPDVVSGDSVENRANYVTSDLISGRSQSAVFTIEGTPELYIEKSTDPISYRGDTLSYHISYGNTGDALAPFTFIRDTLPPEIDFITADGAFTYNEDQHCVSWDIGNLLPGSGSTLTIKGRIKDVGADISNISNTAYIHSGSLHVGSNTAVSELNTYLLTISADPDTIIGDGVSQTLVTVDVKNASNQPAPDGTPVSLTAALGTFVIEHDTLYTVNGSVQNILTSSVTDQEYVPVKLEAKLLDASEAKDTAIVVFRALRIDGIVIDSDGLPVEGAIVTIIFDGEVIGTDTTGADGVYSIAIYTSGNYIIRIQYPNDDGTFSTVDKELDVDVEDPDQSNTIHDLCSISGHLIDYKTNSKINIPDVPIVIDYTDNMGIAKRTNGILPDTTFTDSTGFWYFNDLELGDYTIRAIFDEKDGYHITAQKVDIVKPGENRVNVDLLQRQIIFGAYKIVDKNQVFGGDTVTYTIIYQTMEYAVTDTIAILDMMPDGIELIESSIKYSDAFDGYTYDPVKHELFMFRVGMSPETTDSISFKAIVDEDIISLVNNEAIIMNAADTAYTADNDESTAETLILTPFFTATKSVNRSVAESGDILTYSIKIENKSEAHTLQGFNVYDHMPKGFRYKEGRSYVDDVKTDDPAIAMADLKQSLTWTLSDTLAPGESLTLKYRVIVGLESRIGENVNTAQAVTRMYDDYDVWSNISSADVIVKPGLIQDRGLIFGKVYMDENNNYLHDNNEQTLKGIEIVTEEGIRVITDEYGKYSIPNVRMGDHVLRINEATLPVNTKISLSSSDFLGDARSRLVKISYSGIAKANFPITKVKVEPEPVVEVISEPVIVPVDTVDDREAVIELTQRSLTESMRLIVNDSWSMMLQYDADHEAKSFKLSNPDEIERTVNFLKWQTQMQVEIHERIDHDNDGTYLPVLNDTLHLQTPAFMVYDYLKNNGISETRIHLAGGETVNMANFRRIKGCEVELILLPEGGLIIPDQRLSMEHTLQYSGELPIDQAMLMTSIPEGFRVDEHSAMLDGITADVKINKHDMARWEMGGLTQDTIMTLSYDLIPMDPPSIQRSTEVMSYMTIKTPKGKVFSSDSLNTGIMTRVEMIKFDVTLEGALFDVGSYVLTSAAKASIKNIGEFMNWKTDVNILVEGFTDHTGSEEDNLILSRNRANSVRDYLISEYKISPDRIETTGYGEAFPVADNSTREGRALNRRVEIIMNSNFVQQGRESETILRDDTKFRIENKSIEILNGDMPQ